MKKQKSDQLKLKNSNARNATQQLPKKSTFANRKKFKVVIIDAIFFKIFVLKI